jgi:hypothetical protein
MKKKRTKKTSDTPPIPRSPMTQEPGHIEIRNNKFASPERHTGFIIEAAKVTAGALLENAKGLVAVAEILKRAIEPPVGLKIADSSHVTIKDCTFRSGNSEA